MALDSFMYTYIVHNMCVQYMHMYYTKPALQAAYTRSMYHTHIQDLNNKLVVGIDSAAISHQKQ